jgi:hypothetical protein
MSSSIKLPKRAKKRVICESSSDDKYVYKYSCAMLNLSDIISDSMKKWAMENVPEDCLYINLDDGIEGYEDTPHVTIKYGLHDAEPDNLTRLASGFGSIDLTLSTIDVFNTNPNFDVLKINIVSDKLMQLNKLICDNMHYTDKFPEYIPHATIAYIKKGTCLNLINSPVFDKLIDVIDEIYFTSRSGDEYFIKL